MFRQVAFKPAKERVFLPVFLLFAQAFERKVLGFKESRLVQQKIKQLLNIHQALFGLVSNAECNFHPVFRINAILTNDKMKKDVTMKWDFRAFSLDPIDV